MPMAAILKVKRRLDQDPAEALVLELEGSGRDSNEAVTFIDHPGCSSCRKRRRRENYGSLPNKNASVGCSSVASGAKPAKKGTTVQFDYLTTFSESDSNLKSTATMARRLKNLLHVQHKGSRKAVIVRRRMPLKFGKDSSSSLKTFGAGLSKCAGNAEVLYRRKSNDDSGVSMRHRYVSDSASSSSHDSSDQTCRVQPKATKTYRLKRKFRQLVDADDIDLINSNICAMTVSAKTGDEPLIDGNVLDELDLAPKRWRADAEGVPVHTVEAGMTPGKMFRIFEDDDDDTSKDSLESNREVAEELLYDAGATDLQRQQPLPIFLGELEDWDAVDGGNPAVAAREAGGEDKGRAKLAETEETGSITSASNNSALSSPTRPADTQILSAETEADISQTTVLDESQTPAVLISVAGNRTSSAAEYVYDLYVRRLADEKEMPLPISSNEQAVMPSTVAGSQSSSGNSSVSHAQNLFSESHGGLTTCDGYCSAEVDEAVHRSDSVAAERPTLAPLARVEDGEEDDEENEDHYADDHDRHGRSYSTVAHADFDLAGGLDNVDRETYCVDEQRRRTATTTTQLDAGEVGGSSLNSRRQLFSRSSEIDADDVSLDGENDDDNHSYDDADDDNFGFYADEHHQQQQRTYENDLVDVISRDAEASRRAIMHASFINNSELSRFRRNWLAENGQREQNSNISLNSRRQRRPFQQRSGQNRNASASHHHRTSRINNITELINYPSMLDDETRLQRDRRATLPNVVGASAADQGSNRETRAGQADYQQNGDVFWSSNSRRRLSDAPVAGSSNAAGGDAMNEGDADMLTASRYASDNGPSFHRGNRRNFMIRHQMQPILHASQTRRESNTNLFDENDDDFYEQHNNFYGRRQPSVLHNGALLHDNENFISLSRFASRRSGRRNVMAPTPAPLADVVSSSLTPPPPHEVASGHGIGQRSQANHDERGNLRFYYDNDLDDDDFFAHMSNGEESPHPHSDTEDDDDVGVGESGGESGEYEIGFDDRR